MHHATGKNRFGKPISGLVDLFILPLNYPKQFTAFF
jgi:hypothetical protein